MPDDSSSSSIKVLVCSANLGNAQPDAASVREWLPSQGRCDLAIQKPPRFPLIMDPRRAKNPEGASPPTKVLGQLAEHNNGDDYDTFLAFQKKNSNTTTSSSSSDYETFLATQRNASNDDRIPLSNPSGTVPSSPRSHDKPRLPRRGSTSDRLASQSPDDCFDIIVIGMQEATFDTEKAARKDNASSDDEGSLSDDEVEEYLAEADDIIPDAIGQVAKSRELKSDKHEIEKEFDFDAVEATYEASDEDKSSSKSKSLKSTAGKIFGVTKKVGKAGLKASRKMTNKTIKTAKTVNTLTSSKDHSDRPLAREQVVDEETKEAGFPGWSSTDVLHYRFEEQLPNYDRALSHQLGEMRMVIYYNPSKIHVNVLSVKYKPTGTGGLANKGGIVAEITVNGATRLSFFSAHLEAHEGDDHYKARCTSFMDILKGTRSSSTPLKYDASLASHFMFVMGDLNFRTRLPKVAPGSDKHISMCHDLAEAKDWVTLNKYDELALALRQRECLAGFRTPFCNFDPTFKVARLDGYDYNPKRSPSYTDRILFKTGDQLEPAIKPLLYEPIEHFTTSDHKPIRGAFSIKLNDRLKWKPAVPLFKRPPGKGGEKDQMEMPKHPVVSREAMHVVVTSISCVVNPDNFDKTRKIEKAELPNSYVTFVATPTEAMQMDQSKRSLWKKMTLGSAGIGKDDSEKKPKKKSSSSKISSNFPKTSVVKDTMKPKWKGEHLHFVIRTHLTTGKAIDLSGSFLYITLFDKKEDKQVGSFQINLAQLIKVTQDPSQAVKLPTPLGSGPGPACLAGGRGGGPSVSRGRPASPARCIGPSAGMGPPASPVRGMQPRRSGGDIEAGRGVAPPRSNAGGRLSSPNSPLKRRGSGGGLTRQTSGSGPRGSLKFLRHAPSQSIRNVIIEEGDYGDPKMVDQRLKSLRVTSLKLNEGLMDGGLEVARIQCIMDIWWIKDDDTTL